MAVAPGKSVAKMAARGVYNESLGLCSALLCFLAEFRIGLTLVGWYLGGTVVVVSNAVYFF